MEMFFQMQMVHSESDQRDEEKANISLSLSGVCNTVFDTTVHCICIKPLKLLGFRKNIIHIHIKFSKSTVWIPYIEIEWNRVSYIVILDN